MAKPGNNYKPNSLIWSIMEGDWEDLTVPEIAEVLDTSTNYVRRALKRIENETSCVVPHRGDDSLEQKGEWEDGAGREVCFQEIFVERLKELRKRRGVSGMTLSELCGFSKNLIGLYESGGRLPSFASLVSLADYFDVSLDYLAGLTDNPQRLL